MPDYSDSRRAGNLRVTAGNTGFIDEGTVALLGHSASLAAFNFIWFGFGGDALTFRLERFDFLEG